MTAESHYAAVASVYETAWCYKEDGDFQKWMLEQVCGLLPKQCSSIADIGSGTCAFSKALSEKAGCNMLCVEPSAEMAAKGTERGLQVEVTDADTWASSGQSRFDLLLLKEVRHHIEDPVALYKSMSARLTPGGRVLIITRPDDSQGYPFPGQRAHDEWAKGNIVKLPAHEKALADAGLAVNTEERPYPVGMPRDEWERLVRAQFWSILRELTDEEIDAGLSELSLPDHVQFNDRITFVMGTKQ